MSVKTSGLSAAQDPAVAEVGAEISEHLAQIARLFKTHTKLTLVARRPGHPDGSQDMIVTEDYLPAVIEALKIRDAENTKPLQVR
jgi:hypothetical protein